MIRDDAMFLATLALLSLWLAGRGALRREGRTESSVSRTILAPFGRIVTLPAGTALLRARFALRDPRRRDSVRS